MSDNRPLIRLASGVWVPPGGVTSIIAFGAEKYKDQIVERPKVILRTADASVQWSFDTFEIAVAYADKLGALYNYEKPSE